MYTYIPSLLSLPPILPFHPSRSSQSTKLSRLSVRNKTIYSRVLQKCLPNLKRKENLVSYNGRYLYIASTEVKIGTNKDHTAYAYLGYDVDRASDESRKAVLNARQKKIGREVHHEKGLINYPSILLSWVLT